MEMTKNKLFLLVVGILACSVLLSGCTTTEATDNEDVMVLGEMWDIDNIDPVEDGTIICEKAPVVETLVAANPDFSLKPALATSWESLDGMTWKFELRDDVYFHDGTHMTGKDVKKSLERSIELDSKLDSMLVISSIEVVDDYTLIIKTSKLNPILPGVLHYPDTGIISMNSLDDAGKFVKPIGTGPYVFESFDEVTHTLTIVKNENWWGGEVGLDKLVLKSISDPNTRAMAIENGELDFTVDVPYSETDRIDALEGINVEKYQTPRVYKIDVNLAHEPINDVRVRQAISYAIDRHGIVEHVLYNVGEPAAGPFLPSMVWANKDLKPYVQNFEKANQLLTEAGWVDTDGDGIRDKNGKSLELNLMTYGERPGLPPMSEAIAAQLKEVGIALTPEVLEFGAIMDNTKSGNWDLYLGAYNIAMVPDPEYVLTNWYSSTGPDNGPGYSNVKVDALIEEAKSISDVEERYKKFNEVEAIVYEEQPIILVAYYGCAVVKTDAVKGYSFDPTAHDYRINADMHLEN
ncbi:ABC transporter substrate-binding protein [Methanococcoides sp. SA1]|nr:ABC transporter substrate-binding protein [Methanococcoides sp. SA1]